MSQYDDTNRGALFVNDKRQSENQPNAKGSLNVEGVEYWVSAWTKVSKNGAKYQSIALTRKEQQSAPQQAPQQASQPAPSVDFDDDMPF